MIKIVMPDSACGTWVPDEVLFGDEDKSKAAQAAAIAAAFAAGKGENCAMQRFAVRIAWHQWEVCWQLLNKPMEYPPDSCPPYLLVQQIWDARALEVAAATSTFVTAHKAAIGSTEGLYLHMLHAHAAKQVRRWGDLRVRQSQGLEHSHANRKKTGLNATNRKRDQRLKTMLTFKHVLAALTRLDSVDFHANNHEKSKMQLMQRAHAKIERMMATADTLTAS